MKTLILTGALAILSQLTTFSQGCLPEGITFTTQEQIDNFQANYPGCTEIEGVVNILGEYISNLNGLNEVNSVGGDFQIGFVYGLNDLTGLDNITYIGGSLAIAQTFIVNLHGLENLAYVGESIEISGNELLTNIIALDNLNYVGSELFFSSNYSLTSLFGLGNLSSINNSITLNGNGLTSLNGLENLVNVEGDFNIGNNNLINLSGLLSLTSVGGSVSIYGENFQTLSGLDNISYIGENLIIGGNDNLTSLAALENLTSVGGLHIHNNDNLVNLNGSENLTIQGNLTIYGNESLPSCDVQSICNYLTSPNGTIEIYNNAPGCNSPEEVQQACLTSVDESITKEEISLFPNPATSFITLNTPGDLPIEEAIIYNHLGQKVLTAKPVKNTVDVSGLRQGLYMIEVRAKEFAGRQKLIKQ